MKVDEEGTEAAAVTVMAAPGSAPGLVPPAPIGLVCALPCEQFQHDLLALLQASN